MSSNYCPRTRHIHLNPNIFIQMELNLHQMRHILDNMRTRKCLCLLCLCLNMCICCVCVPIAGSRSCIGRIKAPAGVRLHVCHRCMFRIFHWPSTQALGHISLAVNVCFNSSFTLCLKHNWIAEVNSS